MHSTVELALIFYLTLACRYVLVSGAPSRGDGPFPRTLWELEHAESAEGTFRRQGVLQVTDAEVDWGSGSEYDSAENELGVGLEKEKVDVPGWLDPRIHGGRMLDVSPSNYIIHHSVFSMFNDPCFYRFLSSSLLCLDTANHLM